MTSKTYSDEQNAQLDAAHASIHAALARFGIDGEKRRGRGFDLERAAIVGETEESSAIAEIRTGGSTLDPGRWASPHQVSTSARAETGAPAGPSAGPSFLDTLDRSRQQHATTGEFARSDPNTVVLRQFSGPLQALLNARVLATRSVRNARADRLEARGKEVRSRARRWFMSEREIRAKRVGAWHDSRARNLRSVYEVVQACQLEKTVLVSCGACGSVTEAPARCRRHFFCVPCRGKIADEKRAKLWKALTVVQQRAGHRGLLRHRRHGGRWGFKFLTLTAPHARRHGATERTELFCLALPIFERRLRRYLKEREDKHLDCVAWSRALEWELRGDDLGGHPHAHVVLFVPYVDQVDLAEWWRDALCAVGYELEDFPSSTALPIVHIVEAGGGRGTVAECIKYIFKDIDGKGDPISAGVFAKAYAALEGRRVTQCSRGLMKLADIKKLCSCGASGCFNVKMVAGVRAELRPGIRKARPSGEPRQVARAT